uniref:HOOK N-terminal domain-containing protein n=1 Tax=Tetranychus urticae TaxID=32264 RepID=T1K417_TETUR
MCSTKVTTFLKSPLVTWIKTFQKEGYDDQVDCFKLFDGIFLNSVWQQIETNGSFHSHSTIDETGDSITSRIRNLSSLLYKIQSFYYDSLGQILVLKLPDVVNIGRDPEDECNLEDLGAFLLLLLGSAVQCESKEKFIEAITAFDFTVQESIVACIREIVDNPSSVWSINDWGELTSIPEVDQSRMYSTLVANVNRLAKERDDLSQRVVELVLEIENLKSKGPVASLSHSHHHRNRHHSSHHSHHHTPSSLPPSPSSTTGSATLLASSPPPVGTDGLISTNNASLYNSYSSSSVSSLLTINNNESRSHLVVELAEAKSKYRKVVAELEEKSELVNELKENLEQSKETCNKLRSENLELIQEARSAKAYRDEIDVLNERVRKVDRLENEVQRYKDKINELIFYKSRVEEMREDNRILTETKTMLEEQLECSRKRSEQIPELEAQLLQLRAYSNELQFQRDMDRDKIESLMEEVASLQVEKKSVFEELAQVQKEMNSLRCQYTAIEPVVSPIGLESNLFEQLNNDAAKRVLKLELENQKLHSLVENIRNKDTSVTLMNSGNSKLHNQYQTSSLDSFSSSSASEKGDTTLPSQLLDDGLNYSSPVSGNDSGCVSLVGELNSRLERMEKENLRLKGTIEQLRECEARIMELESTKTGQEKELSTVRDNLQKEIYKTETLERSLSNLTTDNSRLTRQVEHLSKRLEDCSQEIQALEGENSKLQGTAASLRNTVKRLNDLEREVTHLEAENHRLEQERKSNEKEITRLKQALEAKDSLIDEQANKVSSLELEKKQLSKELDSINANAIHARELEKEKQELVGDLAVCKKSLAALRQDLVDEKIKSQSLTSEMERIHYAMSQMSLKSSSPSSPSLLLSNDSSQSFDLPPFSPANIGKTDWSNVLENLVDNMIRRNLEMKESRISALENNLKEVESRKTKLKDELSAMKEKISKSQIVTDSKGLESSLDVMIEEMEKRLKVAEEENKLLRGDNLSLKEEKDQLKEQVKSLQEKLNACLVRAMICIRVRLRLKLKIVCCWLNGHHCPSKLPIFRRKYDFWKSVETLLRRSTKNWKKVINH